MTIRTYGRLDRTHHGSSDRTNLVPLILSLVHDIHYIGIYDHLLRIHFMLCQIFHVDLTEITQARMQCQESELAILDLQTFHQLTAKMQSRSRSHNRTFFRGENILITILVFRFHLTFDILRQRSLAQGIQSLLKLVVVPVI